MKEQIKELRIKIDSLAQLTKNLKPIDRARELGFPDSDVINRGYYNSKEVDKSVDSLYLGKAWLGKLLGELGAENPYKSDGKRKLVDDIEPTDSVANDKTDGLPSKIDWQTKNHIEKVDWLRQEIETAILDVKILDSNFSQHQSQRPNREFAIARTNAYNHLSEARIWLGFELGRLREESKK